MMRNRRFRPLAAARRSFQRFAAASALLPFVHRAAFPMGDLIAMRQMSDDIAVSSDDQHTKDGPPEAFFAGPRAAYSRGLLMQSPTARFGCSRLTQVCMRRDHGLVYALSERPSLDLPL